MTPHFTIITPTVLRPSLLRACESVNTQTFTSWQHIILLDCEISDDLIGKIAHRQRQVYRCERPHQNWGHTCRHAAYGLVKGDFIYHLDDDNFFPDNKVLEDLKDVQAPWAIFPILRYGEKFFNDPPGKRKTDTGSFIVKREYGKWIDSPAYDTDGDVVEQLLRNHPNYQSLPDMRPLMVMEKSGGM